MYGKKGQRDLKLFFRTNCKRMKEKEAPGLLHLMKLSARLNFLSSFKARNESWLISITMQKG